MTEIVIPHAIVTISLVELEEKIREAMMAEREACAKIADAYNPTQDAAYFAQEIAEQIRARR